jgi:hypothetical protein
MMLLFDKVIFRPGVNMTVRRGDKWAKHFRNTSADRYLEVGDSHDQVAIGEIKVLDVQYKKFFKLSEPEIDLWHARDWDPDAGLWRKYYTIQQAMEAIYTTPRFNTVEMVTVLTFDILSIHGKAGKALERILRGES